VTEFRTSRAAEQAPPLESWENRHAAWIAAGNLCRQCEVERERGVHGADADSSRGSVRVWAVRTRQATALRAVACACWGDGTVLPVLRRWALFPRPSAGAWYVGAERRTASTRVADGRTRLLEPAARVLRARIAAEAADVRLQGLTLSGPVQSRPEWELKVRCADAESRAAWLVYAERYDELLAVS
jgi:hypothetical protein